jgi:hypothetical protein
MEESQSAEPLMERRRAYQPTSSREQFIVPLLRSGIDAALREYAAPLGRGKKVLDMAVDPPPDLFIEVEVSHSILDRLSIAAGSCSDCGDHCNAHDQSQHPRA